MGWKRPRGFAGLVSPFQGWAGFGVIYPRLNAVGYGRA
jgi:hypothetical protein